MKAIRGHVNDALHQGRATLRWLLLVTPVALTIGSACAFFLWSLDAVTRFRFSQPWLLWCLPVAGVAVGLVYHWLGRDSESGNNLIIEQIHEPGGGVPRRMAPLILWGTLMTHLCGGSAGREGTAVQMGGSLASAFARAMRLPAAEVRVLLMCGVAAGFGAVFGTPLAGAVFALEVLVVGRLEYGALVPCFIASVLADATCQAWGVGHTTYHIAFVAAPSAFHVDPTLLAKVVLAAVAFGWCGTLFAELSHRTTSLFQRAVPYAPLRPALGGVLVIGLTFIAGTQDYLGLGVLPSHPGAATIPSFFTTADVPAWSWLWKIAFTVITLSAGFKGGEVTPLFFIGAGLGHSLGLALGAPTDLFAALGFVAIFAGATNTPLACTLMGIELFGATHGVYLGTACFLAYLFSGHSSIYGAQRIGVPKHRRTRLPSDATMRSLRDDPPR